MSSYAWRPHHWRDAKFSFILDDMIARTTSTGILLRLLEPESGNWTPEVARALCRLDFAANDHMRVEELSAKAQAGTLSDVERSELDEYLRVADMLAIVQAKARTCLNGSSEPAPSA